MAGLADALQEALAQRALNSATPATLPAVQRSAYLADALQNLRQNGGQNLRTPGALASNLLAEGLEQYGLRKQQQKLATQTSGNETAMAMEAARAAHVDPSQLGYGSSVSPADTLAAAGMSLPPGAGAPAAGTPGPAPSPMMTPPAAPPAAQVTPPPQAAQPQGFNVGPQDEDAAIRMAWGEARGEGAAGQQADVATAMHRAQQMHVPLAQIISAPGQFAGFSPQAMRLDPNSPEYQRIKANVEPVLQGQMDPVPGADHFWAPQGIPGGAVPGWAQGMQPIAVGNQRFVHTGSWPGSTPPAAPGGAPGPFAMAPGSAPPQPQSAMGGALPPPQPPPGGAPPASGQSFAPPNPAVPPPLGAGNSPAPGGPQGQSPGAGALSPQGGLAATPQELALIQQYLHSPYFQLQEKGRSMLMDIAQRQATPQSAPGPEYQWDPQRGQWTPKPGAGFTDISGGPAGMMQRDGLGKANAVSNPNVAAPPAGFTSSYGPNGQAQLTPQGGGPAAPGGPQGGAPATFRLPGASGLYMMDPATQRPIKVAEDQFDPQTLRQNVLTSDAYKDYQNANAAWKAMQQNATSPNGISGYALKDTFARVVNPGAVARVGTIQAIGEAPGLPDQIKQMILHLGDGAIPPNVVQQLLDAAQPFAMSHYQAAQQLNQSNTDLAQRHQMDPRDVTAPMDQAPGRFVLPQFRQQPGTPPAAPGGGNGAPNNEAAAELIRRGYHWNGQTFVK